MSDLTARAAYLKGLAEGMKLDQSTDERKLLLAVINVLEDYAKEIDSIDTECGFMSDSIADIEDEVDFLGSAVFHGEHAHMHGGEKDEVQVKCPNCGEDIVVSMDDVEEDEVVCPACGAEIELDLTCGCDDCE